MRVTIKVEKAIEQQKIAAYVVGHLPIIKSYAVKIGLILPIFHFLNFEKGGF
jgi:hypothetical protein